MNSALGLVELLLVLFAVMAWGAYELWSVRRVPRKPDARSSGGDSTPQS